MVFSGLRIIQKLHLMLISSSGTIQTDTNSSELPQQQVALTENHCPAVMSDVKSRM